MTSQTNQLPEMLEDTLSIGGMIKTFFNDLNRATRTVLSYEEILSTKRILLTGCGDSYFAGIAAKYAFEKYANIPAVAASAMDVSRYHLIENRSSSPDRLLVLAVSVSGEISRAVEAVLRANQLGKLTCAVTGNPESRIGMAADRIIRVPSMPKRSTNLHVPGTRSFTASLMSLYLLAYHMGEVREVMTVEMVNRLGQELLDCADTVDLVIDRCKDPLKNLVSDWSDARTFFILGSGPNYATALFTAAKMVEAAGVVAVATDVEEWAHFYNFSSDSSIPVMIFAPADAGLSRTKEIIDLLRRRGRRLLVVTTADAGFEPRQDVLVVHDRLDALLSPLVLSAIGNVIGSHLRESLQVPYFNNFPPDPHPNGNTIVTSQIELFTGYNGSRTINEE